MTKYTYMLIAPLILLHLFFIYAVVKKNLSVIDTAWGLGFILIAFQGCNLAHWGNFRENILFTCVTIWGLRLTTFIHFRNRGKGEDFRYANWRKQWGHRTNVVAYFKVYWLQYFLMLIVALPLFAAHNSDDTNLYWFNYLGIVLWATGTIWESVADMQKSKFKAVPTNHDKVFQGGLWSLSRHPNYFGEALLWWGIALISLDGKNYWALTGAAFINLLLWKVTGVPLIEERHAKNPVYQTYKSQTPTLIPDLKKLLKIH